jgi:hypothetical protein
MPRKGLTMARVHEVLRLIQEGLSDRQIARALALRRSRVAEIRGLGDEAPTVLGTAVFPEPLWTDGVDWEAVDREIREGHELKRIWEERAAERTSYPNFWKYLNRRFAPLLKETVTLREFEPGGHCEVDYSGDPVMWWDERNRPQKAQIFVGILCHSQLLFALATVDQKKASCLLAHQKMYAFFGGVSRVTVPDNTKTGVLKAHLYDPDLNPAYLDLAIHYGTAVVPDQGAMDGGAPDPLPGPDPDLGLPGPNGREHGRGESGGPQNPRQDGIVGKGRLRGEPPLLKGDLSKSGGLLSADESRAGQVAVGFAQPHADKNVSVLVHLEPPVGHEASFLWKAKGYVMGTKVRDLFIPGWIL